MAEARISYWVSDRSGDALIGLGPRLRYVRRVQLRSPLQLVTLPSAPGAAAPRPVGGGPGGAGASDLWVVSAAAGTPLGAHELVHLDGFGQLLDRHAFGPLVDLDRARDGTGQVLALEMLPGAGSSDRIWVLGPQGGRRLLAEFADLSTVSGRGGRVVVGNQVGEIWLLDLQGGAPLAHTQLATSIADLAPGPAPGSWWMLESGGSARLALLGPDLQPRWQVATSMAALHLIPVPGEERVWLADTSETLMRRYGPAGALEIHRDDLVMGGLDRGVARPDGGVLLTAAGALLAFDGQGMDVPGQGGFQFLVDVAALSGER